MENSGKSNEKVVSDLVEGIRLFSQLVNVEVNKIISEAQEDHGMMHNMSNL